jgi:hypothetical protein
MVILFCGMKIKQALTLSNCKHLETSHWGHAVPHFVSLMYQKVLSDIRVKLETAINLLSHGNCKPLSFGVGNPIFCQRVGE